MVKGNSARSLNRQCPRSQGSTKLPDGGSLIIGANPHYISPKLPTGYTGHFPKIQFLYGISQGKSINDHYIEERENTFTSGYSQRPKLKQSVRSIVSSVPQIPTYRLAHFDQAKRELFSNLEHAIQIHRDKYRDLTGKRKPEPYFAIPKKFEDLYHYLEPINSYYLHKNRRPLPGRPDSSWSYVHQMTDIYYHKCRDPMGSLFKCYKNSYHRRTQDPDLQPVLHGYR